MNMSTAELTEPIREVTARQSPPGMDRSLQSRTDNHIGVDPNHGQEGSTTDTPGARPVPEG